MNARLYWNGFQRSRGVNVADVDETVELALGTDDELVVGDGHDSSNALWLPDLFWLIFLWWQLTSKSHSPLFLLLGFIFLLILLHLKLHNLNGPALVISGLPQE